MIDKIIEGQTLDVDTVSGATYSSRGIISAVKNALTGEKDSGTTGQSQSGSGAAAGSSTSVKQWKTHQHIRMEPITEQEPDLAEH